MVVDAGFDFLCKMAASSQRDHSQKGGGHAHAGLGRIRILYRTCEFGSKCANFRMFFLRIRANLQSTSLVPHSHLVSSNSHI
jgi:hypothetical protein